MPSFHRRLLMCLALIVTAPALATESDPPGRVGRISLAPDGIVLRISDSVASGSAALNWPLTTGALIETAEGARGEARIGSTALRLDGGTQLEFLELNDERIWLRLNRGSVAIFVQNPEHAAELALDTPQGRLRLDSPGSYRADVASGTTAFSTYRGGAFIEDFGLALRAGERVLLLGGRERSYLLGQAARDAFHQWASARELNDVRPGKHFVSPEMTGREALEQHGRWQETTEYGAAWFPAGVAVGWAPYRSGRWAWVPPWGWTWIDQAPWGFAPFHYGRWALVGGQWAWLPGTYVARPIYAPALVAWLGQPGWNISVSVGAAPAVGWYPLGPREVYYPHYRSSLHHVHNINIGHVRHVTQTVTTTSPAAGHYRHHLHRPRHDAVTATPRQLAPAVSPERVSPSPAPTTISVPSAPPSIPEQRSSPPRPAKEMVIRLPEPGIESAPASKQDIRHPTVHAPRPHKTDTVAPMPAPVIATPAPQRQPRFEAARDPAPRSEPQRQHHATEKKREADPGEQPKLKRGLPDR